MKNTFTTLLFTLLFITSALAQAPKKMNTAEIYEAIQKLNFLGSVLYVAAHPDDENTRLISYLANDVKARTAYLSITRGDGGQNLIGPELREALGVIRTQELLEARKIDGGEQYFTRANDFGYSKHPDETFEIWDKNEVLNDMVAVIRKFKPDVIINRFNHKTPGTTHGHHTASAMLSLEAFEFASKNNYQTHLKNDFTWQPKRLFFNTSWWFYGSRENFEKADKTNLIGIDVGSYYATKGLSNNEIAALSRSQHQSQGFGSIGTRGSQVEYLELLKGTLPKTNSIFEGINTSWFRVDKSGTIHNLISQIEKDYDFKNPAASLPKLLEAYKLIQNIENNYWKAVKTKEIKSIIEACSGLFLEVIANKSLASKNSKIKINIEAINRSSFPITLEKIEVSNVDIIYNENLELSFNELFSIEKEVAIPQNTSYTSPYWLFNNHSLGMYNVADKSFIGMPETPKTLVTEFLLNFGEVTIPFKKEIVYKYNSPVVGEVYKPFEIVPKVTLNLNKQLYLLANENSQRISIKLTSNAANVVGKLKLNIGKNWQVSPKIVDVILSENEEKSFEFTITSPSTQSESYIEPIFENTTEVYNKELVTINYPHIPFQTILKPARAKAVRLQLEKKGNYIGYIQGAGDEIPNSLRKIGYTVVELNEEDISLEKLKNFDAVILGIRAYNTNVKANEYQPILHNYIENGGTLIAQYNTSHRLKVANVGTYPIQLSRDRVAEETAEVNFLLPNHEILNAPNIITKSDFDGWVQERGLYFPNEWDAKYDAILSMNDQGENAKKGSLLVTKYGKGYFIYTGLSFFRELPAGVPGAYKLFANMLSIGKNPPTQTLKN